MAGLGLRRAVSFVCALAALVAFAPDARAINLTIEQEIPVTGSPVPLNAEGIAVVRSGPNAGIYVPHRDTATVTVLDLTDGHFLYNFSMPLTFSGGNMRAIDVLPNGNLLIGQHTSNLVREVIIPPNPGNGTTPAATLGTIAFGPLAHTDHGGVTYDEFESLSVFARPSDGQLFVLLGEEGLAGGPIPPGEYAGEVFIAQITSGGGLSGYTKLFDVPFADNDDDISGIDVIDVVFDGLGNIDFANSKIIITDDSSGGDSGAFVLNLLGDVIEGLDGPGASDESDFESLFGQPWRDAEGVDYDPATGLMTFVFSDGATGTPRIVTFLAEFEGPPVPEPTALPLVGSALAGLVALRRRRC